MAADSRQSGRAGAAGGQRAAAGAALQELAEYRMPFGKYKGRRLIDLPEAYVVWFSRRGFPQGRLGELLREVYEIKVNGLEHLFEPLRLSSKASSRVSSRGSPKG